MSEQHTPGPWEDMGGIIHPKGTPDTWLFDSRHWGRSTTRYKADRALATAAPELLDALEELAADVKEGWFSNGEWRQSSITKAVAAIAKAKGGPL